MNRIKSLKFKCIIKKSSFKRGFLNKMKKKKKKGIDLDINKKN